MINIVVQSRKVSFLCVLLEGWELHSKITLRNVDCITPPSVMIYAGVNKVIYIYIYIYIVCIYIYIYIYITHFDLSGLISMTLERAEGSTCENCDSPPGFEPGSPNFQSVSLTTKL